MMEDDDLSREEAREWDEYIQWGSLENRYENYVRAMRNLGQKPVDFDTWLNR